MNGLPVYLAWFIGLCGFVLSSIQNAKRAEKAVSREPGWEVMQVRQRQTRIPEPGTWRKRPDGTVR